MSELTQPIHLFIGDLCAKGGATAASAGAYASPNEQPIYRVMGAVEDEHYVRPVPAVDGEWALEHVLARAAGVGAFTPRDTPANVKVVREGAAIGDLRGSILAGAERAMARAAEEPIFADLESGELFSINGKPSIVAISPEKVYAGERPYGVMEREGFSVLIEPNFASNQIGGGDIIRLGPLTGLQIFSHGAGTSVTLSLAALPTVGTHPFDHVAGEPLRIIVDWRRRRMEVFSIARHKVLGTAELELGSSWAWLEPADATFGPFNGRIYAPQRLPRFASPRCDLIVLSLGEPGVGDNGIHDLDAATSELIAALAEMRSRPWGATALVWLVLPPAHFDLQPMFKLREAMHRAASTLQGVSVFETDHLERLPGASWPALTGESTVALARSLARDFAPLLGQGRRAMARPRGMGFQRFASAESAKAFVRELVEAGLEERSLNPLLGGWGEHAGIGLSVPWSAVATRRSERDIFQDPNTGEYLVPVDLAAAQAGFGAPPGDGVRVAPSDAGQRAPVPLAEQALILPGEAAFPWSVHSFRTDKPRQGAQLFDPIGGKVEARFGELLVFQNIFFSNPPVPIGDASFGPSPHLAPNGTEAWRMLSSEGGLLAFGGEAVPGDTHYAYLWVRRDTGAQNFSSFAVHEHGTDVAGVLIDQSTGSMAPMPGAAPSEAFIGQKGEWFLVALRYTASVGEPELRVSSSAGLVSSWPNAGGAPEGALDGMVPIVLSPSHIGLREFANATSYANGHEVRLLRSGFVLVEDARTNLIPHGEDLSQWAASPGCEVCRSSVPAPDGSASAWDVRDAAQDTVAELASAPVDLPNGVPHSATIFIRKDTAVPHLPEIRLEGPAMTFAAQLDLATGELETISGTGLAAVSAMPVRGLHGEDWWRVEARFFLFVPGQVTLKVRPAATTRPGTVDEGTTGTTVCAQPQLEEGQFASTYIPTHGAPRTRPADLVRIEESAIPTSSPGSILEWGFEFDFIPVHESGWHRTDAPIELVGVHHLHQDEWQNDNFLRLVPVDGEHSRVAFMNDLAGNEEKFGSPIRWSPGDRLTFRITFEQSVSVSINGVQVDSFSIVGEGNWNFGGGALFVGRRNAYGAFSPLRKIT